MLAGGQSLIPMLALRLAVFEHLVDIGRIAELQGIERRDGALWIGAGTTRGGRRGAAPRWRPRCRCSPGRRRSSATSRSATAARSADRSPTPTRPPSTRPSRWRSTRAWRSSRRRVAARSRRATSSTASGARAWSPTSCSSACRSRSGAGAAASPSRSSRAATATSRSPAPTIGVELDGDDRIRRCAIGLIGLGSTPERADGRRGRARGPRRSTDVEPEEVGRLAMAGLASVPSDLHGSAEYRKRVGAAMVARAWTTAGRGGTPWVRCRCS